MEYPTAPYQSDMRPTASNERTRTILLLAMLLEHIRADDCSDDGYTPIHYAAANDNPVTLGMLLSRHRAQLPSYI